MLLLFGNVEKTRLRRKLLQRELPLMRTGRGGGKKTLGTDHWFPQLLLDRSPGDGCGIPSLPHITLDLIVALAIVLLMEPCRGLFTEGAQDEFHASFMLRQVMTLFQTLDVFVLSGGDAKRALVQERRQPRNRDAIIYASHLNLAGPGVARYPTRRSSDLVQALRVTR